MAFAKNLKESGYSFNQSWSYPKVNSYPKAEYIAGEGVRLESGNALKVWTEVDSTYDSERGEYYFNATQPGRDVPWADSTEILTRWRARRGWSHFFEEIRLIQPDNYYHPVHRYFYLAQGDGLDWEIGDEVRTASGGSGFIYSILDESAEHPTGDGGRREFGLRDGWVGTVNDWREQNVENVTKGTSYYSDRSLSSGHNNKTTICWCDINTTDDYASSYASGGYNMEVDSDNTMAGSSFIKFQTTAGTGGLPNPGTYPNELEGAPTYPLIFDRQDNGHEIGLMLERKRSDSYENPNGEFRVWKYSLRPGSGMEDWTLIFELTGMDTKLDEQYRNKFEASYILGPANSGYLEDTTFKFKIYRLWDVKPDFLP